MAAITLPSNVVEILKVGLAGLCFLLSLLAFWLIHREQQRKSAPRKPILRAIYVFMSSNLIAAILVGLASYLAAPPPLEDIKVVRKRIDDLVAAKTGVLDQIVREPGLADDQRKRISDTITQLKTLDALLKKAAQGE